MHSCLEPLSEPYVLLLQEGDPAIRSEGVECLSFLMRDTFLQDFDEPLQLGTEAENLILPLRIELRGDVIVFVGLELFQKVGKCEDGFSFKGHGFFLVFSMGDT